jgi:hypothetical protein
MVTWSLYIESILPPSLSKSLSVFDDSIKVRKPVFFPFLVSKMVKKTVFGAAPFSELLVLRDYDYWNMVSIYSDHILSFTFLIKGWLLFLYDSENGNFGQIWVKIVQKDHFPKGTIFGIIGFCKTYIIQHNLYNMQIVLLLEIFQTKVDCWFYCC